MWETAGIDVFEVGDTDVALSSDRAAGCIGQVPMNNQVACDHIACCH